MRKILVIDDEPDVVALLKTRLESAGYRVVTAGDGREGLKQALEEKPDLILLDIIMPAIDGNELCWLLKDDARTKEIPVVMLTAKGTKFDRSYGLSAGAAEYVTKPYDPKDLLEKIEKIFEKEKAS